MARPGMGASGNGGGGDGWSSQDFGGTSHMWTQEQRGLASAALVPGDHRTEQRVRGGSGGFWKWLDYEEPSRPPRGLEVR